MVPYAPLTNLSTHCALIIQQRAMNAHETSVIKLLSSTSRPSGSIIPIASSTSAHPGILFENGIGNGNINPGAAVRIPDGTTITKRYKQFVSELPELRRRTQLSEDKLIFVNYVSLLLAWLKGNDWKPKGTAA